MIDVKKLITGFLILAAAAVCSGLVLSFVNTESNTAVANTPPQITISGGATSTALNDGNAFTPTEVNQIIAEVAPELASSTMYVSSTDQSNLTDDLAAEFVNGVVAANPNGPVGTDANGNPTFTPPNVNTLAANLADTTTTADLQIPNWDVEVDSIPVTVIVSNSSTLTSYGEALSGVTGEHFNDQVQSIVNDDSDSATASDLAYVESQIQGALQDTASLKVPSVAEGYQKALLAELVYEKNMIQLNDLAQTDPVKANLILQQEDQKFSVVQQNLLTQAQGLTNKSLSLQQASPEQKEGMLLSFMDHTFGIPQAQAQVPVFDAANFALNEANDDTEIGDHLQALLVNTLLQILKNTLIALIQREVLTWVQGNGAPRFITNWGTQLVNAAEQSALNTINSAMTCGTYPAFVAQQKVTLNSFYQPATSNVCANQFAAALGSNSLQQFYNSFKNGGFVAFGASTLPSGNPYGSLFFNAQTVALAYQNQQAASGLKAQSSQGLNGTQVCDDGSDPTNGEHTVCENPDGPDYNIEGNEQCGPGDTPVVYANNGLCADGTQPQVTTPAAATGFALQTAVGGTTQQVASANNIAGILASVLNSLLTSLANMAVNAAGQFVNQGLTSLNPNNINGGGNPPPALPLACNPATQTVPLSASSGASSTSTILTPVTVSATGGTVDANDNPPTYSWTDSNGNTGTGSFFTDTFSAPGNYTATVSDSANDAPATCNITIQP